MKKTAKKISKIRPIKVLLYIVYFISAIGSPAIIAWATFDLISWQSEAKDTVGIDLGLICGFGAWLLISIIYLICDRLRKNS